MTTRDNPADPQSAADSASGLTDDSGLLAAIHQVFPPTFRYATVGYTLQEGSTGTALKLVLEPTGNLLAPRIVGRDGLSAQPQGEDLGRWQAGSAVSGSRGGMRLSLSVLTRKEQPSPEGRVSGYIRYYPEEGVSKPAELEGVVYCTAEHMARLAGILRDYGQSTEWVIQTEGSEPLLHFLSDYLLDPLQPVRVRELAAVHEFSKAEQAASPSTINHIQGLLERIENHLRGGVRIRIF